MKSRLTNRLKACMADKGINQSQLAGRLGVTRSHVTRLVKGQVRPGMETALRLARYFGRPVEEIFQLDEEASP